MATKSQIIKRALVRAGVVAFDQIPTSGQSSQVDAVLTSLHENWVDQGSARWELADIPQELENAIVSVLAYSIADDFGLPSELYQRLVAGYERALRTIYAYNEIPYSGNTTSTYF